MGQAQATGKSFKHIVLQSITVILLGSGVITLRLGEKDKQLVFEFAKDKRESRSDLIRKALLQYIQKEKELNEIKAVVAKKFAEGKISFDELVRVLGFEEAKKVAFFVDVADKSFQEGI